MHTHIIKKLIIITGFPKLYTSIFLIYFGAVHKLRWQNFGYYWRPPSPLPVNVVYERPLSFVQAKLWMGLWQFYNELITFLEFIPDLIIQWFFICGYFWNFKVFNIKVPLKWQNLRYCVCENVPEISIVKQVEPSV